MHSPLSAVFLSALALGAAALPQPQASPSASTPTTTPTLLPSSNNDLIAALKTDATAIQRFQRLLTSNGQLLAPDALTKATVYDFGANSVPVAGTNGGTVATANIQTFPILLGSGLTINIATLGACGVFAPHVHPRASEFFAVVSGSVSFGYMPEMSLLAAGSPQINGTLKTNEGTLFPQGSIHFQVNDSEDCKPMTAVVTLSSEDPGTTPVLMERRANGTGDIRDVLPAGIVEVVDKCMARCGGKKV